MPPVIFKEHIDQLDPCKRTAAQSFMRPCLDIWVGRPVAPSHDRPHLTLQTGSTHSLPSIGPRRLLLSSEFFKFYRRYRRHFPMWHSTPSMCWSGLALFLRTRLPTSTSPYSVRLTITPPQNLFLRVPLDLQHVWNFNTSPRISRTLSIPATYAFTQFHRAIQTGFKRTNEHAFNFERVVFSATLGYIAFKLRIGWGFNLLRFK